MLLFRSEEHIEKWCRDWRFDRGATLTLGTAWRLAKVWYSADRRDPQWRRFTSAEIAAAFGALGLTGPFWSLD